MSVADNKTHRSDPRPSRRFPKTKRRKTSTFKVTSAEHQRVLREALQSMDGPHLNRHKRAVIAWMTRRLSATLHVHDLQTPREK